MNLKRLALLVPLLALGASPRADFRLEAVLPETTLVFAEIPSAPAFRDAFRKTPLAKLLDDEEVRAFLGDAMTSTLRTLSPLAGAGDKADFSWEKMLENISGQIAVGMPTLVSGPKKEADFVLTIDCLGHKAWVDAAFDGVRKKYESTPGKKAEVWKSGDTDVAAYVIQTELTMHMARAGETAVFTTTKGTMEKVLAAIHGGQPKPLAKSASFLKARDKVAAKEVFVFADLAGFVREAKEDLEEHERKFIAALGLEGFTYAAGGLSVGDQGVNERFFVGTSGDRKGLAKFLSLKGAAAGFEVAPKDALQFASLSVELPELYDTLFEILKVADEFELQKTLDAIAEFEKDAGFSIKTDLFPAFGPRIWSYNALPPDSVIPDTIMGFEIRDAARFDKCLQAIVKRLSVERVEMDFKGRKISYFRFTTPGALEDPARIFLSSLYFIREGDKLLLGNLIGGANALKRHILRSERPTLAAQDSVLKWTGGRTDGASYIVYMDVAHVFSAYYNTLSPFALFFKGMLRTDKGGVDLMKLPLGETLAKYLGQAVLKVSVEPDGLRAEGISDSGVTLLTGTMVATAGVVLYPAISRANEENKLSQCRTQSSTVYFAVLNHLEEKKKYPEKTGLDFFKQLKEANYLLEDPVCPISGGSFRGPAKDVNTLTDNDIIFCDEPANHPDGSINILRRNGATGTLRPADPEYNKALESTKGK